MMVDTSPNRWATELGNVAVCEVTHLSNKGCVEFSDKRCMKLSKKGCVEPSDEACHGDVIYPPSHTPSMGTERVL